MGTRQPSSSHLTALRPWRHTRHTRRSIVASRAEGRQAGRARTPAAMVVGAVIAGLLAVALAGCSHSTNSFARLTVDGQASLVTPSGGTRTAHNGEGISAGDRVQVTSGEASVHLRDGMVQLRAGSELIVDDNLRLMAGAVLIQPAGKPLRVSALTASLIVPSGAAQMALGGSASTLIAKVYQETSELDLDGNPPSSIAAPRQAIVAADNPQPVQATPLKYEDADGWDHLYLAPAIAFSGQLAAAAAGFNAQVPANQGKDAAFYQQLVPGLSGRSDFASAFQVVDRTPSGGSACTPGDCLIASVIALRGTKDTIQTRLANELAFYGQGAPWGFVAYDQGITDLTDVVNDVLSAIGRATLPFTGPPGTAVALGPPPTAAPPTSRPTTRVPATTPTTSPRGSGSPTTTTTTTTAPAGPPPLIQLPVPVVPGPLGNILNPLLDPLIQALNNILSGKH